MAEASHVNASNTTIMYAFRFGTSDKLVHLTQQQLDLIPYLSTFVAHKDDFLSIQNENGEYVLNHPIEYTWFISILRSVTSEQPYTLFNELPENDNILDVLQLFDYLGIKPFSLPFLRDEHLVQTNPINFEDEQQRLEYRKANLSEARQTAAEFIIALAKNEYKLRDTNTRRSIFNLINVILFNTAVFNPQFRHHTLTVARKRCYMLFSKVQRRQLETTHRIAQGKRSNSFVYLSDDDKPFPDTFRNTFTWRGVYVPIEDKLTDTLSPPINWYFYDIDFDVHMSELRSLRNIRFSAILTSMQLISHTWDEIRGPDGGVISIEELKQDQKKQEAASARSGSFNTLPKRPTVDKFKHRSGPKAQKHR